MSQPFGLGVQSSREDLIDRIDGWLCGEPMRRLAGLFSRGFKLSFEPTESFYNSFVSFVDDRWNSRGIVTTERYATQYKPVPSHLHPAVYASFQELGLSHPSLPSFDSFDAIIAPGSQLWSMVMRVGYMRELRKRSITAADYVGLGSERPLSREEADALGHFSLSGHDEYTLMRSIMWAVFEHDLDPREDVRHVAAESSDCWSAGLNGASITGRVSVLRTSDIDGRRPTTGDTLRHWVNTISASAEFKRVLVITQPLYLYQQGSVAIDVLGIENGFDVEVVGASTEEYLPGFVLPEWTPERILQEVNGSVKRLVSLRSRLLDGQHKVGH